MNKKTFDEKKKRHFNRDEEFDEDLYEEDNDDEDEVDTPSGEDGESDETDYPDDDSDYPDDDSDYEDDDSDYEDDDSDEEDDDDDEDDYYSPEEIKRARRRNRRIRNVILAYCVMILLVVAVFGGIFLGGRIIFQNVKDKKQEATLAEQLEEISSAEEEILITEPEDPAEVVEEVISPLDEIALAKIAEMPIEDKVAALFMVTPDELTGVNGVTKAGETTQKMLEQYKVGGIVYTADNLKDDEQVKKLLSNTALIDPTLLLAVKETGGKDSLVASKTKAEGVEDASTLGSKGDTAEVKSAGSKVGAYLAEYGFNMNLAPSADIWTVDGNVLGTDGFGSDPAVVGSLAASYIGGLQEQNIHACVTTFPGLGSVVESTAAGMANSDRTLEELKENEFISYKAALEAGAEFMMVGTISASGITGDNTPCCLSKTAIDLVRNELSFDGVVMTGALNEASVTDYHTSKDAVIMAIRAGADMIYMPENFKEAYEGLLEEVKDPNGSIDESRIDESLLRIYRVKYKDKVENLDE